MPAAERGTLVPDDLRERVSRHAKLVGAICAVLLVVDLVTGPGFWAHFPGIVLATLLLLEAAPLMLGGWFNLVYARGVVVVGGLALINLVTWSGSLGTCNFTDSPARSVGLCGAMGGKTEFHCAAAEPNQQTEKVLTSAR